VYDRIADLALDIVNASFRGERAGTRAAYQALKAYLAEQEEILGAHPTFPETLADFSTERRQAIRLYHRALRLARRMTEPLHTIQLSLGELYLQTGDRRAARRWLNAARADACKYGDSDEAARAEELLQDMAAKSRLSGRTYANRR
jgi:hypothetical protein